MISPDASPIAHVSPYKRIELGSKDRKPEPKWEPVEVNWAGPGYTETVEVMNIEDIYCG